MAIKLVKTTDLTHEEWLEWRRKGIGGSDVSAILGLSKWRSPLEVYFDKKGELEPKEENEKMYFGSIFEGVIAEEFEKRTGKTVKRTNYIYQHAEYPFVLANIDRLVVGENAGLECKNTGMFGVENEIPIDYVCQCQHYIFAMGWDRMYLAILVNGNKLIIETVERDNEFISMMLEKEKAFWAMVEAGEEPMPVAIDAEFLDKKYSRASGDTINLEASHLRLIEEWQTAKRFKKLYENTQKEVEGKFKAILKDAEKGLVGDYEVCWKNSFRKNFNSKGLKEDDPELYESYLTETQTRRFEIKEKKEKG